MIQSQPCYRIIVADSRMPRDGRTVEELGTYSPITRPGRVTVEEERVYHWLKEGAQPSDTVASLFRRIGLMRKWAMMKAGQDVSEVTIGTELKETTKPGGKAKRAKEATAAAAEKAE